MTNNKIAAECIFGAYLADAASLGFHWLYDPVPLARMAGKSAAFRAPDPADFEGHKGIFVHFGKARGELSQYGAQMDVMHQSLLAKGAFDLDDYLNRFQAKFGPGGAWRGYVDKATKGTLANIVAQVSPTGLDDDQLPAIAKLPPLMVALRGQAWSDPVDTAVVATSNNATAQAWAVPAAAALATALDGSDKGDVLRAGIDAATPEVATILQNAVDRADEDPADFAGELGRACPLPQALPVSFQIIARAQSYEQAVEDNIRAAGDNCGRAIFVGSVAAALFGLRDAPLEWVLTLDDGAGIWADCQHLAGL